MLNRRRVGPLLLSILVSSVLCLPLTACNSLPAGPVQEIATRPASSLSRQGEAYLIRGWRGLWSQGIDHLGDDLRSAGIEATVFRADQTDALGDTLAKRFGAAMSSDPHNSGPHEPLVLIGYSYGADDAIAVAAKLGRGGVGVDLLVTLDPVTPPAVPPNVRVCRNYYQSNSFWDAFPWLRGIPLKQAGGSPAGADFLNIDIRDRPDLLEPGTSHATIAANPRVRRQMLKDVLSACPPRR